VTKFYGVIGFGASTEKAAGVWTDDITEVSYFGDVIRNTRKLTDGSLMNDDLSVSNSISIVADAFANENFFAMRYIRWAGTLWEISDVEVRSPRLILTLGGVYNGPGPTF
jgi:hypothetical protein